MNNTDFYYNSNFDSTAKINKYAFG